MQLNFLKKVEGRVVYIALFSVLPLTLLASYLYLFKKSIPKYTQLKNSRVALEMRVKGRDSLPKIINSLNTDITTLHNKIFGANQVIPADEMIAATLSKLDTISVKQQVTLISVKPEQSKPAQLFTETPFSVEVRGKYSNLYQWLYQVEQQLAPMIVKQFTLSTYSQGSSDLSMKLKLASYQPVSEEI